MSLFQRDVILLAKVTERKDRVLCESISGSTVCEHSKVYSELTLSRDLALIDRSAVPLHKLGISRKDLIECDGSQYLETRAWALALHDQFPDAEGLTWTSRQADPARALVLFGDRLTDAGMNVSGAPSPLRCRTGARYVRFSCLPSSWGSF